MMSMGSQPIHGCKPFKVVDMPATLNIDCGICYPLNDVSMTAVNRSNRIKTMYMRGTGWSRFGNAHISMNVSIIIGSNAGEGVNMINGSTVPRCDVKLMNVFISRVIGVKNISSHGHFSQCNNSFVILLLDYERSLVSEIGIC
jgi:hypothetical protein